MCGRPPPDEAMRRFDDAVRALYRRIKYRLFGLEAEISGECHHCGACCRNLVLLHRGGWISAERDFEDLLREDARYERFSIAERAPDGCLIFTCSWLTKDNRCANYEERMDFCKSYPSPELYFHGRTSLGGCGFVMRPPSLRRAVWEYRHGRKYSFQEELDQQVILAKHDGTDA